MTVVEYNDVEIRNVLTRVFDQTSKYDESGTDLIAHFFRIVIVGHVVPYSDRLIVGTDFDYSSGSGFNAADAEIELRLKLMEGNKQFTMKVGNRILLQVGPMYTSGPDSHPAPNVNERRVGQDPLGRKGYLPWDVANGPKPRRCSVTHIVGTRTMRVEYEIDMSVIECGNSGNDSGVINNRWSTQETMDDNFYTTRVVRGRLRVQSPGQRPFSNGQFRRLVMPRLQFGFQRKSVDLASTPDGLCIDYVITDVEGFMAPPFPATKWEGTHTRSRHDPASMTDEVWVRIEASKEVSKGDLITLALRIIEQKLELSSQTEPAAGTLAFVEDASLVDYMNANTVEARLAVRRNMKVNASAGVKWFSVDAGTFGEPIAIKVIGESDYKKDIWRQPDLFGTATPCGIFACYLQDACSKDHGIPQNPDSSDTSLQPQTEYATIYREYKYKKAAESIEPAQSGVYGQYNSDAFQSIYSYYKIDTTYEECRHFLQLPLASSAIQQASDPLLTTALIVVMAPPTGKRFIHIHGQRYGMWPKMPKAAGFNPNPSSSTEQHSFVSGPVKIRAQTPEIVPAGGTRLYEIEMTVPLVLSRPSAASEPVFVAAMPYDTYTISQNSIPPSTFINGIITPGDKG